MKTLLWLGLGAAAMYLFDKEQGPKRRAQLRERLEGLRRREAAGTDLSMQPGEAPSQTPEGAQHLGR